jgi:hypothetical protein
MITVKDDEILIAYPNQLGTQAGQEVIEGREYSHSLKVEEATEEPTPPKLQHIYLDPLWGGPIGSGSRRVIEGSKAEWKGKPPSWQENTDYVNPKMWDYKVSGRDYIGDRIPTGVRLFNPIFENITNIDYMMYINHGHAEERNTVNFVIFGGYSKGVKAKGAWAEFKTSKTLIEDHVIDGSCGFGQYVRQRHGRQLVMVGGRGKGIVAARGWCHWIDVPDVTAQSWAGPLPYRSKDWMKMHTGEEGPWAGKAWQGTELLYAGKTVKKAVLGVPSGGQKSTYPSLNCSVHPDLDLDEKEAVKGTKREALGGFRDLWRKAGLL